MFTEYPDAGISVLHTLSLHYTLFLFSMSDSVPLVELATTVILLLHIRQITMNAGCRVTVFEATIYTYTTAMTCG